jgi:hypothetical protein
MRLRVEDEARKDGMIRDWGRPSSYDRASWLRGCAVTLWHRAMRASEEHEEGVANALRSGHDALLERAALLELGEITVERDVSLEQAEQDAYELGRQDVGQGTQLGARLYIRDDEGRTWVAVQQTRGN